MRRVCGGLDPLGIESVQVAVSFITVNAPVLASSFGQPAISCLYNKYMDVNVTFSELDLARQGPSAGACAALALALLLGANLEGKVAVSGCIDLRGRVLPVGVIRGKTANARKNGVTMLLLPECWSWRSKRASRLRRDGNPKKILTLLEMLYKGSITLWSSCRPLSKVTLWAGFTPPPSMATLLDSTRVGVGRCLGLIKDEVRDLQVQSCYVESGDRDVLMTGNLSSVSKGVRCRRGGFCGGQPSRHSCTAEDAPRNTAAAHSTRLQHPRASGARVPADQNDLRDGSDLHVVSLAYDRPSRGGRCHDLWRRCQHWRFLLRLGLDRGISGLVQDGRLSLCSSCSWHYGRNGAQAGR